MRANLEVTQVAAFDGPRGLIAAVVMPAHIFNSAGVCRFSGFAMCCVFGFFINSGHVLTRSWRGSLLGFLVRRFVRLWPLFALCIALGGWLSMNPAPLNCFFWLSYSTYTPQDPVAWSLFIEAWVMPFMPLIMLVARRRPYVVASIAALIVFQPWCGVLYYGIFFVVGSHFASRTMTSPFLRNALPQWLGRISYSLYLSHMLTIGVLKYQAHSLWIYLAIPVSLAIAHILSFTIEAPSIALSRRAGLWVEQAPATVRGVFLRRPLPHGFG